MDDKPAKKPALRGYTLVDRTLELLRADRRTLAEVAKGSEVPLDFLKRFSAGYIKAPSCDNVISVYEFLTDSVIEFN